MEQVLVELHQPKRPTGTTALVVSEYGRARATTPEGEQELRLPNPTRKQIEAAVASVPWQELPEAFGDLTVRDDVLRCAGREVHVGIGGDPPQGILKLLVELGWISTAVSYPSLIHVMRSGLFSGDPHWMNLRIEADGRATLGTISGGAEGRLEEGELGRVTGILEGMRFTELEIRDQGRFDWELVHGFNRVVLENDTMDQAFVPLLKLCSEIEMRLRRAMPPPVAGA